MTKKRKTKSFKLVWQETTIKITFEADWNGTVERDPDCGVCHIVVQVMQPDWHILPITDTGYRSHFTHPSDVEDAGGPVAFVRAWLDEAAKDGKWLRKMEAKRQLDLFT
jgi:hypothetical protein